MRGGINVGVVINVYIVGEMGVFVVKSDIYVFIGMRERENFVNN